MEHEIDTDRTTQVEAFFTELEKASNDKTTRDAAREFMEQCGLEPTPDALDQLVEVFVPCLRIMCERGWDPNGGTWKKSGRLGIFLDVDKKFERLKWKVWEQDDEPGDSAPDLINFVGFLVRSPDNRFGERGEPGRRKRSPEQNM